MVSIVSVSCAAIAGTLFAELAGSVRDGRARLIYVGPVTGPIRHFAAWFVWHSLRISLLDDLKAPHPPGTV
jgi:hypothetical protein